MKTQSYPSDLTDAQWALLDPVIPAPRPGGRPRKTNMRQVVNAIFYLTREGCSWRALPHDFPPWKTVYNYFEDWKRDGTWGRFLTALRRRVRRQPRPHSPRSLHRQSVGQDRLRRAGRGDRRGQESPWPQTSYRRGYHGVAAGCCGHGCQYR